MSVCAATEAGGRKAESPPRKRRQNSDHAGQLRAVWEELDASPRPFPAYLPLRADGGLCPQAVRVLIFEPGLGLGRWLRALLVVGQVVLNLVFLLLCSGAAVVRALSAADADTTLGTALSALTNLSAGGRIWREALLAALEVGLLASLVVQGASILARPSLSGISCRRLIKGGVTEEGRRSHPEADGSRDAFARRPWHASSWVLWELLPALACCSALGCLRVAMPEAMLREHVARSRRAKGMQRGGRLRVAAEVALQLVRLLCGAAIGVEAFVIKLVALSDVRDAASLWTTLFMSMALLNQVLGATSSGSLPRERLLAIALAGEDGVLSESEAASARVWSAALAECIWEAAEPSHLRPLLFLVASLSFSDVDFQRLVRSRSHPPDGGPAGGGAGSGGGGGSGGGVDCKVEGPGGR